MCFQSQQWPNVNVCMFAIKASKGPMSGRPIKFESQMGEFSLLNIVKNSEKDSGKVHLLYY